MGDGTSIYDFYESLARRFGPESAAQRERLALHPDYGTNWEFGREDIGEPDYDSQELGVAKRMPNRTSGATIASVLAPMGSAENPNPRQIEWKEMPRPAMASRLPTPRRAADPESQFFDNPRNSEVSNEDYFGPPSQVAAGAADVGRDLPDLSALAASLLAGGPAAAKAPVVPEGWRATPGRIPQEDLNTFANALGLDNEMKGLVSRQWDNAHARAVTEGVQTARANQAKRIADAQLEAIKAREASKYGREVKVGNRSVKEDDYRLALRRANQNEDPTDMFSYIEKREPGVKAEMPKAPMGGPRPATYWDPKTGHPFDVKNLPAARTQSLKQAQMILNNPGGVSPIELQAAADYVNKYRSGKVTADDVTAFQGVTAPQLPGAVGGVSPTERRKDSLAKQEVDSNLRTIDVTTNAIKASQPKGGSQPDTFDSVLDATVRDAKTGNIVDGKKYGSRRFNGVPIEVMIDNGESMVRVGGGKWQPYSSVPSQGGSVPAPPAPAAPAPAAPAPPAPAAAPTSPPAKDPNRHSNVPAVDDKTTGSIRPIEPTPSPNVREFGVKLQQIAASDAPRVEKLKQLAIFKKRYGVTDEDIAQLKSQMTA